MGFLDDLKNEMGEEARERYEELKHRGAAGDLDDQSRAELSQLRERLETSDSL